MVLCQKVIQRKWSLFSVFVIFALSSAALLVLKTQPDVSEEIKQCHFDKIEIDLMRDHGNPVDSPLNQVIRDVKNGKNQEDITWEQIGHPPQFILAYPSRVSFSKGQMASFHFSGGVWQSGAYLSSYRIFDALNGDLIEVARLPETQYPLLMHYCGAWYNGGCDFPSQIKIDTSTLPVSAYFVFFTDNEGNDSAPTFFNVEPAPEQLQEYDVTIVYNDLTWAAYNRFGGGSLYSMLELGRDRKVKTFDYSVSRLKASSLLRPMILDPGGTTYNRTFEQAQKNKKKGEAFRYNTRTDLANVFTSKRVFEPLVNEVKKLQTSINWTQRYEESPLIILPFYKKLQEMGLKVAASSQKRLMEGGIFSITPN